MTIPGPRGQWLVGDVVAYQRDRIGWLTRTKERYGDFVRLSPGAIVVHDPETAHSILAATNDAYLLDTALSSGNRARRRLLDSTPDWMATRRDVWHGFAAQLAVPHVRRLLDATRDQLHAGGVGDLLTTCRAVCGRAIVDLCIGGDPADRPPIAGIAAHADKLFLTAQDVLDSGEARLSWWPRPRAAQVKDADAALRALLTQVVERRGRPEAPRDFLDAVLSRGDQPAAAVQVLRTALFASHGVPGVALAWIVLRLHEHPTLAAAIAREAHGTDIADRPVGALPLAAAFVQEVLRLHPPQWLLARTALRPASLAGHRLKAGQQVLISPYLIHRDPRWWPDPLEFRPQRWLEGQRPHSPHAYLPFAAGPRICPGSNLALVQLTALTALIAGEVTFELPPLDQITIGSNGLLTPVDVRARWSASRPSDTAGPSRHQPPRTW
ncbi:cytochrome P450 [Kibdelosporangium aridum]|uniref:Cytochrome P450 n=1 Tax=Kibdelosporangium aridum TaxID=2030 RepID=A0A428Z0M4_KIBAR|nr:cytochrome P450 [Kibdelosporangium aridum]RSM77796.1 cytochrome P450 [Kibdelosporangium aridum]